MESAGFVDVSKQEDEGGPSDLKRIKKLNKDK